MDESTMIQCLFLTFVRTALWPLTAKKKKYVSGIFLRTFFSNLCLEKRRSDVCVKGHIFGVDFAFKFKKNRIGFQVLSHFLDNLAYFMSMWRGEHYDSDLLNVESSRQSLTTRTRAEFMP